MKQILMALAVTMLFGCSGIRTSGNTFTTHAEAFRIFGYPIPADDQTEARRLVPAGATITTQYSTPADWTSIWGFIGNLFWLNGTQISGTMPVR